MSNDRNHKCCNFYGPTGPQGMAGSKGEKGCKGATGPKGCTGPMGPRGVRGYQGCPGPAGPRGLPGKDGCDGPPGPTGCRGYRGCVGPTGPTGCKGCTGATGCKGERGYPGPRGCPGPTGATGCMGPTGCKGEMGCPGPRGCRGATGSQGPPGPTGCMGLRGPIGPSTKFNIEGANTETGPATSGPICMGNGDTIRFWSDTLSINVEEGSALVNIETECVDGFDGPTGPTGPAGVDGAKGDSGPQGDPGATCVGPTISAQLDFQLGSTGSSAGSGYISICKIVCDDFNLVNLTVPNDDVTLELEPFGGSGDCIILRESMADYQLPTDCRPGCTLRFSYKYNDDGDGKHGYAEISTDGKIKLYPAPGDSFVAGTPQIDGNTLWCNSFTFCASTPV